MRANRVLSLLVGLNVALYGAMFVWSLAEDRRVDSVRKDGPPKVVTKPLMPRNTQDVAADYAHNSALARRGVIDPRTGRPPSPPRVEDHLEGVVESPSWVFRETDAAESELLEESFD